MQYSEEELDLTLQERVANLEKDNLFMREALTSHAETIKEAQRYIIQLAQIQSKLTKQLSQCPYIAVPSDREE